MNIKHGRYLMKVRGVQLIGGKGKPLIGVVDLEVLETIPPPKTPPKILRKLKRGSP